MKLLCITVIYKRDLLKTEAYRTLLSIAKKRKDTGIFIYDNSPAYPTEMEMAHENGIEYVWDSNNGGVSKAYNAGARYAVENGFDRLLLLDQDTRWENGFLEALSDAIFSMPKEQLIVPRLLYENGIFSPLRCKGFRPSGGSFLPGVNKLKNVAIVNSGISVTTELFCKAGGYDEKIPLDFADFCFIGRLRRHTDRFLLLDVNGHQDFSDTKNDPTFLMERFRIYCRCLANYTCESRIEKFRLLKAGLLHSLKLSVKTGKPGFLFHFICNFNTKAK